MQIDKYEYMLHTWGGFYNEEFKKIHKKTEGYFFFDTKDELDEYLAELVSLEHKLNASRLMWDYTEGQHVRYKTIAKMKFVYDGKEYEHLEDFGFAYPVESAKYMFELGSYSCDCNRSRMILRKYGNIEELDCGRNIEMINLEILQIK